MGRGGDSSSGGKDCLGSSSKRLGDKGWVGRDVEGIGVEVRAWIARST